MDITHKIDLKEFQEKDTCETSCGLNANNFNVSHSMEYVNCASCKSEEN